MEFAILIAFGALLGLGMGSTIASVGKPGKSITPAVAVVSTFTAVAQLVGVYYLYTH